MRRLLDAREVVALDLPLIRYTIHPYGVECDAWPPALDRALASEEVITGWEVWAESVEMRR